MSGEKQPAELSADSSSRREEPKLDYYPPPPPGPPPSQQNPQHTAATSPAPDVTAHQNYQVPSYDPSHPNYAPSAAENYTVPSSSHEQQSQSHTPQTFAAPLRQETDLYGAGPVKPPASGAEGKFDEDYGRHFWPGHHHNHGGQSHEHGHAQQQQQHASGGEQTQTTKAGWGDRLAALGSKAAAPINMLANKMGSEAFLPTTMDKECEKAARTLRSFCKDGIYSADTSQPAPPPSTDEHGKNKAGNKPDKNKNRTILTIPPRIISKAVGLAIFTTARVGFQMSGATGSGILIARNADDGSWSPPSGIQVHSVGAGFVIGADIYDCVVVINTRQALEAFTRTRVSLGSDLAVTAGPWGAGGSLDFAAPASASTSDRASSKDKDKDKDKQQQSGTRPVQAQGPPGGTTTTTATTTTTGQTGQGDVARAKSPLRQTISNPVYAYVKSRGFYAGVQIDGTIFTERKDANAAFYGGAKMVPVESILRGEVAPGAWKNHTRGLFEVIRGAEGKLAGSGGPVSSQGEPSFGGAAAVGTATAGMQHLNVGNTSAPSPAVHHNQPQTQTYSQGGPPMTLTKEQQEASSSASGVHRSDTRATALPAYSLEDRMAQPPAYADDGHGDGTRLAGSGAGVTGDVKTTGPPSPPQ